MAKKKDKVFSNVAETAKESDAHATHRRLPKRSHITDKSCPRQDKVQQKFETQEVPRRRGGFPFLWGAYPFHSSVKAQKKSVLHKASFEESAING
jgi:hypothetical protein